MYFNLIQQPNWWLDLSLSEIKYLIIWERLDRFEYSRKGASLSLGVSDRTMVTYVREFKIRGVEIYDGGDRDWPKNPKPPGNYWWVNLTLDQIKIDIIMERLKKYHWHQTQSAQSLKISVPGQRMWIDEMRKMGFYIPDHRDYEKSIIEVNVVKPKFVPIPWKTAVNTDPEEMCAKHFYITKFKPCPMCCKNELQKSEQELLRRRTKSY